MEFLKGLLEKYRALPDGIRLAVFGGGVALVIWILLQNFWIMVLGGGAAVAWHYFREKGVFGGENILDITKGPEASKEADDKVDPNA